MYKAYFKKIFCSPSIYFCILMTAVIASVRFLYNNDGGDVVATIDIMLDLDGMRKVILIFAAVPFAANYCTEYNNGYANMCLIRTYPGKYINSNLLAGAVSSFAVTFMGLIVFLMYLSVNIPFYESSAGSAPMPYGYFLNINCPIIYIMIRISIYAVSNSMWVISGIALSSIIPNSFAAICSPYIFSYVLEKLTMKLPDCFNLFYLTLSRDILGQDALITYTYTIGIFIVLMLFWSFIFRTFVRRRIKNEIV